MTRSLEKNKVVKTDDNDVKKSDSSAKARTFSLVGWPIIVFLFMAFIQGDKDINTGIVAASGVVGVILGIYFGKKTNDWFPLACLALWTVIFAISSGMFK